jgi:hypothetical protein
MDNLTPVQRAGGVKKTGEVEKCEQSKQRSWGALPCQRNASAYREWLDACLDN